MFKRFLRKWLDRPPMAAPVPPPWAIAPLSSLKPLPVALEDMMVDDWVFLIKDIATGEEWRIYADGQIAGWEGRDAITCMNRLPELLTKANALGFAEAESLKEIPETTEEWFREAKLKVPEEKDGRQQKG